jgi:hypothetical protein
MNAKKNDQPQSLTVSEYFDAQVSLRQITLQQLSVNIGGAIKPNMLSMIRQGHSKLPLKHVAKVARALGVDPMFLMKLCLQEYQPENWHAIQEVMGNQPLLTHNEIQMIEAIRKANPHNPKLRTQADEEKFVRVVASLRGDNE